MSYFKAVLYLRPCVQDCLDSTHASISQWLMTESLFQAMLGLPCTVYWISNV